MSQKIFRPAPQKPLPPSRPALYKRGGEARQRRARRKRSVLVLGGGFAGLSAAIHLATQGYRVKILEQAPQLGGKASQVQQHGYRWDTGPSLLSMPEVLDELYAAAGETCPVHLQALEPLTRYFFPSGRQWDVFRDDSKTLAGLNDFERDEYLLLKAEARKLYQAAAPTFLFKKKPNFFDLALYAARHGWRASPNQNLADFLSERTFSAELQQFFLRFATYFGADPHRAPAVLHNIAWAELGGGAFYPQGGIFHLVKELRALAERLEVEVETGVRIDSLKVSQRRVSHAYSAEGSYSADWIVSALDVVRTHQLLQRETPLAELEPSLSAFVILLEVKQEHAHLQHHNISFSPDYANEFERIRQGMLPIEPTIYISISSKSNPSDAPQGCENWFILVNAPALHDDKQLSIANEQAYAKYVIERLVQRRLLKPQALGMVHVLPMRHLSQFAYRGAIYGHAPHSLSQTLRPKQRISGIDNLFLASGTVHPGGGIPLALLSGKHAATMLFEHNL